MTATEPIYGADPWDPTEDVPFPDETPTAPRSLPILTRSELDSIPPPVWLIDGILTKGFGVLYGPPGHKKSFLALDWACSVATGSPWFGKQTTQGDTLYVAAEGTSGIPKRVDAWEADRRKRADGLLLLPQVVDLLNPRDVQALAEEVSRRGVSFVVVDTLARSMPGGDENSAQDMGRLIHAVYAVKEKSDVTVLVVHHSGVDGSRERGSTALHGAVDMKAKVVAEGDRVVLSCEKQKDAEEFDPWFLRTKPVGESIVLGLSQRVNPRAALALLEEELSAGPLSFDALVALVGGHGDLVLELVEAGKLRRSDCGSGYVIGDGRGYSL